MPNLPKICKLVAKYYHVPTKSLCKADHINGNLPRKITIYLAAELSGKKIDLIAYSFKNISASGISQIVSRTNRLRVSDPSTNLDIDNLIKLIQNQQPLSVLSGLDPSYLLKEQALGENR